MKPNWLRHRVSRDELADKAEELLAERLPTGPGGRPRRRRQVARRLSVPRRASPDRRVELECLSARKRSGAAVAGVSVLPGEPLRARNADLYGIRPIGHPRPRRLVRHAHWPEDWHPMRADAGPAPQFAPTGRFPFVTVEGTGVYEIPVGPVHAGLIEPGHFRFSVVGETVLRLKARLWFVHRGLEKLFEGRPATGAADLAERVSGDTSAAHALAHSLAVEDALGIEVARRGAPAAGPARRTRTALQPRRRPGRAGQRRRLRASPTPTPNASANNCCALNAAVTGHRLLRGAIRPGGVDTAPAARPRAAAVDRRRPRRGRRADPGQHRGLRPVRRHLGAGLRRRPCHRLLGIRRPGQRYAHRRPHSSIPAPFCPSPRSAHRPVTSWPATPSDATSSPPRPH